MTDGWVLVPREPTEAMLRCIRDTPANEFDAVDVANRIRAALTGEDA